MAVNWNEPAVLQPLLETPSRQLPAEYPIEKRFRLLSFFLYRKTNPDFGVGQVPRSAIVGLRLMRVKTGSSELSCKIAKHKDGCLCNSRNKVDGLLKK